MDKLTPPLQATHTERIISLDVLKCFAIFLVCWAHSIQHLTTADCIDNLLYRWIYSFHMPLFMMVSGFFSVKSMGLTFSQFIEKKLKQIALPGFAWSLLFSLIGVVLGFHKIHFTFDITRYMPFWFLWALLICNILAYAGVKFKGGRIVTLLISQFIPFANVIYMYPAFVLGQIVYENRKWIKNHLKQILIISVAVYLVSIIFWGADDWHLLSQTKEMIGSKGYISAGLFYVGKTAYKLLVNLSGSMMFFCLFLIADSFWGRNCGKILGYIGKYTLIVYILQYYILEQQMSKFVNLDNIQLLFFNFVATPLIAVGVILVCVFVAMLVDKNRYTRLVLLGR